MNSLDENINGKKIKLLEKYSDPELNKGEVFIVEEENE